MNVNQTSRFQMTMPATRRTQRSTGNEGMDGRGNLGIGIEVP
jgi:hypothetical protein